jgi:hypothetical protein
MYPPPSICLPNTVFPELVILASASLLTFNRPIGQDFDEQIKNLAVEYEQTTDGNTEAYFTLLTLASFSELVDFQPTNCPNITKPSPPNQIINKRPSIFDTHRRFFGNDFKRSYQSKRISLG